MPLLFASTQPSLAVSILVAAVLVGCGSSLAISADLSAVSLFDGERNEELLNTWGGVWNVGSARGVAWSSGMAHTGRHALAIELGAVEAGQRRYVQCSASGFGPSENYCQTRDLQRYRELQFRVLNRTGADLTGFLQIKDHRDSEDHCAIYPYSLGPEPCWTQIRIPQGFGDSRWVVRGKPDLRRVLSIDFIFEPHITLAAGEILLDDVVLMEPGGPLDSDSAPLSEIVQRLARRQWDALWSARHREHGMLPNHSYQATDAGLNVTAALLWMLPAATRRGWVEQEEADAYVEALLETIGSLLDRAKFLPPRNVDWVSLRPSLLPEESSVDAAFLALALHQYKTLQANSSALSEAIDRTQQRFNFAAFASPRGWRMAYRYASASSREGLVDLTYDGYTNESSVVSLAAHLSRRHHVPIETFWTKNGHRVRAQLVSLRNAPVVHSWKEFRAPFTQALFNLFVDVRGRGLDIYPDETLATNPWFNFVCYQQDVMARLAEMGRPCLVQPDAGDDGTLNNYQQFSVHENFGQEDLFMPWSIAFALLAGADGAEDALRHLLCHGLHGPLGLADSARWETGAPEPYAVTARHDFWNTALSTMALLEWLDGQSRSSKRFSELPEVKQALDQVFPASRKGSSSAGQLRQARLLRTPALAR